MDGGSTEPLTSRCEEIYGMVWVAREGALKNLSPGLGARAAPGVRKCHRNARPRRRPLQNLALRKHFAVAASAATNPPHIPSPPAERGARIIQRAFARDGTQIYSRALTFGPIPLPIRDDIDIPPNGKHGDAALPLGDFRDRRGEHGRFAPRNLPKNRGIEGGGAAAD